ncbi:MAG: hypothetical protein JOZ13_01485 [Alphaproteobacteria bacterium]|nr:hypothetical protein [Alphaproteobacteria bacterium]
MRDLLLGIGAAAAVVFATVPANAALTVSNDPTSGVSCLSGVCTATASHAVLNVSDVTTMLANANLTLVSGNKAKDIVIAAAFSWTSANTLELDANRGIAVNQAVVVAGPGGLTVTLNDGGSGGDLRFVRKGHVEFWDTSSNLTIGGHSYTLVKNIKQLAGKIANNPTAFYALAQKYNAAKDGTYGGSPVSTAFSGVFEGLGNPIVGLTVADQTAPPHIGLFDQLNPSGVVRDVALSKVSFSDFAQSAIGAVVGDNQGTVANSSVSGQVTNMFGACAGTLVGFNERGAMISNSQSSAPLTVNYGGSVDAGGLVGCTDGTIQFSAAAGNVQAQCCSFVGGLAGYNFSHGIVLSSSASGKVSGTDTNGLIGGLVGRNDGAIQSSFASGDVTGADQCGGLVGGTINGSITKSHASGNVTMLPESGGLGGGLVGQSGSSITQSYATGNVTGDTGQEVGGLVGYNLSSLQDSYASGNATTSGTSTGAGGLVGLNIGTIARTYSTGAPQNNGGKIGGSVGWDNAASGNITSDYWDTSTSGVSNLSQGAGNIANDPGIAGLTTTQLQSGLPSGFSSSIWGEDPGINGGLPYLLALPPR